VQIIGDAEALSKGGFQRVYASASRIDEGAINIEKKQALLHFCHVERSRDISYCSSGNVQLSASILLAMRFLDRASLRSE